MTVLTPAVAGTRPTASEAETVLADHVSQPPPGSHDPAFSMGPLKAGQAFGTRYHIIKGLGAGGMGVVYQAWDAELGVAVALKVIRPEVLNDPGSAGEVERRFKRELVLARQVTHKHVVRIHDLGELTGIKYLTMPFVEGENLADVLKRDGKTPVPRTIAIAKQIASGLQAAHEVGVVHRDLKPENIMIGADGGALIMDFGISRSVSGTGTATALGAVIGTLEYMAPEQAQGLAVDHRADIYSFGLVLYDMLTGRQRIARRENAMSEMMSRMQHAPPSVRTLDSHIPETLDRIISRCLQADPKARYATTAELVADLEALAPDGHRLTPVHPVTASRTTVLVIAAIMAAVLGTAAWWIIHTRGRTTPAVEQAPISVLIANFENRANEPLFDGLIEQALGVGIEGTSFVTAYPRRDALKVAQQINPSAPLDENNARLVATREGIKRIVSGSISSEGTRYALTVKIIDPSDGKALLMWDTTASDRNDVLTAVGRLAAKVRRELGDTSANADQIKQAETFTAASLEAAHEYVQAQELQAAGKYREALEGYQKALDLDPKLGRAYAGQGAVSSAQLNRDKAVEYYKQALGLIDRMTDREKFRTRGGYYAAIGDNDKSREQYEALVKQFPADSNALSNLAVVVANQRDMSRALELGRKASAIYPNNVLRRNNVALFAMYAGDFEFAEKQAKDVLATLNKDYVKAYLVIAMAQLGTGRPAEAEVTWQQLQNVSAVGRDLAAQGRADLAIYEGRLKGASKILEDALAEPSKGRTLSTARSTAMLAEVRQLQGREAEAIKLAEEALQQSTDPSIALFAGRVLILAGKPERGDALAAELDQRLDQASQLYAKLLAGEADLKRNAGRAAIGNFNAAQKILDTWLGRDGLGRGYLMLNYFPDAQTEFEACLRRKGEATTVLLDDIPTYRLLATTRYYLARVQEGQSSPAASASYKAFLTIKEKGDEQGLVADARRRLAALK